MAAYNWFRVYHGTMSDPKWPLIARRSGQAVGTVVAIWMAILEFASQHETRGSLEGFCSEEIDALYGYEEGTTQSVFKAMESRGIIEGGMLVAWDKRQGTRATSASTDNGGAPMTPAERSRRYRERQREQRDVTKRDEMRDETFHNVTQRDNGVLQRDETQRDVTKRADKIREDKKREDLDLPPYIPPTPDADAPASESEGEVPSWLNEPPLPENEMPLPEEASPQEPEVHLQAEPQKPTPKPKSKRKKANLRPDDFEAVWAAYPARPNAPDGGKGNKERARKIWDALCAKNELPDVETLLATLEWQKQTQSWQNGYIHNFSKYLDDGMWKTPKPANFTPYSRAAPQQNRFGQGQPYRGKPTGDELKKSLDDSLDASLDYLYGPEDSAETVYDASISPFGALPTAES